MTRIEKCIYINVLPWQSSTDDTKALTPVSKIKAFLRHDRRSWPTLLPLGGFEATSETARLTALTSLIMRVAVSPTNFMSNE
jgi:hypothetical protein